MAIQIGGLELGKVPRIAVPIDDTVTQDRVAEAARKGLDLIELRIDRFSRLDRESVAAFAGRFSDYPTLATIRAKREGGAADLSESDRLALFEAVLPEVDAVDIEISSASIAGEVVELAKAGNKTVIGSFHDFDSTPPRTDLRATIAQGAQLGVDIVKLATRCDSGEDLKNLVRLLLEEETPLIIVGMGTRAGLSRIFFPALGSLLTYSFLDAPVAPGQLSLEETARLISLFYGE